MIVGDSCRVRILADGYDRELSGSPMDILREMRGLAFEHARDDIGDYVRWLETQTGATLAPPKDEGDEEAAAATMSALERAGFVRILEDGVKPGA